MPDPTYVYVYAACVLLGALAVILGFFAMEAWAAYKRKQNYDRLQRLLTIEDEARRLQR